MPAPIKGPVPKAAIQNVLRSIRTAPSVTVGGLEGVITEIANEIRAWSERYAIDSYFEALGYLKEATANLRAAQETLSMLQVQQMVQESNNKRFIDIVQAQGKTKNFNLYFTTNDAQLAQQLSALEQKMYTRLYTTAIRDFVPLVKENLKNIIVESASTQEEGAFPKRYVLPLLRAIDSKVEVIPHGNKPYFVLIEISDLFKVLGDYDDFEVAFHHKALLKNKKSRANVIASPVLESSLFQENKFRRYQYWRALYQGQSSYRTKARWGRPERYNIRNRLGQFTPYTVEIPIEGSWDETVQARLQAWYNRGQKAPQWLILEFGQNQFNPRTTVVPGNIYVRWYKALAPLWDELVKKAWDEEIGLFNSAPTPAPPYGEYLSNKLGRYYQTPSGFQRASAYAPIEKYLLNPVGRGSGVGSSSGIFGELASNLGLDESIPYWHTGAGFTGVGAMGLPASPLEIFEAEQERRLSYALSQFENELNIDTGFDF